MNAIVNNDSVKPAKSASQKRQTRIALSVFGLLIAGVGAAYYYFFPQEQGFTLSDYDSAAVTQIDLEKKTQASGTSIVPVQMIVPSPSSGYAQTVLVAEGERVEEGQVMAELHVPELDEQIEDLQASLKSAQLSLKKLKLQQQISLLDLDDKVEDLAEELDEIADEIATKQKLVAINSSRKSELDALLDQQIDLLEQLQVAQRNRAQTEELQVLDLASSQASLDNVSLQLSRALADKEATRIKSPMDGEIIAIADELAVPGSKVAANASLFTLAAPESTLFSLDLEEEYAGVIQVGQVIDVTVGSIKSTAEIVSIGRVAEASSDGLGATVELLARPTQSPESFLMGSTVIATIVLGVEQDALVLPRGAFLTTGGQKVVYVINGQLAEKTSVSFGDIEGNWVQVNSGLKVGQQVITSGYQNYISHTAITLAGAK